jgi:hypothetical protein
MLSGFPRPCSTHWSLGLTLGHKYITGFLICKSPWNMDPYTCLHFTYCLITH